MALSRRVFFFFFSCCHLCCHPTCLNAPKGLNSHELSIRSPRQEQDEVLSVACGRSLVHLPGCADYHQSGLECAGQRHPAGPSVNHQGVWIPNPVAQVEHHVQSQINSLKYKYSLRHLKDRAKHNAMQHSSLARMILEAPRKFHNIQNAIKY